MTIGPHQIEAAINSIVPRPDIAGSTYQHSPILAAIIGGDIDPQNFQLWIKLAQGGEQIGNVFR